MTTSLKTCFKCNQAKERTEFYKHSMMSDGLLGKCKDCTKRDTRINRRRNIDYYRAYDLERSVLPHRVALHAEQLRAWRKSDPRYGKAHNAVARAIVNGLINRETCLMCGSTNVVAHHDDYDKPLEVMWLCNVHHASRHAFLDVLETF